MTYIAHFHKDGWGGKLQPSFDWHAHTARSLAWQYGPERAKQIMAGLDPAARKDLAAWQNLGRRG